MNKVVCEECGKLILNTSETSKGKLASIINYKKIGIAKMPIFYGITDGFHFFCCKDCFKVWLNNRTTPAQRAEGDKHVAELEEKKNEIVDGITKGLKVISKLAGRTIIKD